MGSVKGDKKSGEKWGSVSKRPPTHTFSSHSPILIRYILSSLMFYPVISSLTYTSQAYPYIPFFLYIHLYSLGIYSSSYPYSLSPMLFRYNQKAFFTLPIPHKHKHKHIHIHIPTRYISWATIQLLLPIVSSKNSPKTKNPETRSTTGFQGEITSNFSQWK